jgi:heme exporter protein C
MTGTWKAFYAACLLLIAGMFAAATVMLVHYAPGGATEWPIEKILYLHIPVAIDTFVACALAFVASVGFLWQRRMFWDDLAFAASKVAVLLCTIVLVTGMIWGKAAWGMWWTWSPRLTFSLMLWLLYVIYLVVRSSIVCPERRAMVAAIYGFIAFLDVPLVYLSSRLMPEDKHPANFVLPEGMRATFGMWFLSVTLATALLIVMRCRLARQQRLAASAESPASAPAGKSPAATLKPTGEGLGRPLQALEAR